MKKIVMFAVIAILAITGVKAQIKAPTRVKTTITKTPPAPAPVNKTVAEPSVYKLTSVRVKVKTGSDNKEFPSEVAAFLRTRSNTGSGNVFNMYKLSNEMKVNSETEFGMQRTNDQYAPGDLASFQNHGVLFILAYQPNFFADAWKIEGITLVLEFKDQHGNLHPTHGTKTIVFSNAYGFLDGTYRTIDCITDGDFSPLTATIRK